jgi:hypothetical protein
MDLKIKLFKVTIYWSLATFYNLLLKYVRSLICLITALNSILMEVYVTTLNTAFKFSFLYKKGPDNT